MTTKTQVVDALCKNLQIPGIGETIEHVVVERAVTSIYDHVPPFVWTIVVTAADGLQPVEIDAIVAGISDSLAKYAKLPWLPEIIRKQVIDQVLATIRQSLHIDNYLAVLTH